MIIFDSQEYEDFDDDEAVVVHELGHAATWLHYAEAVGRMKFIREAQSLKASTLLEIRNVGTYQSEKEAASRMVERILAGECAARRFLGFDVDAICSDKSVIRSDGDLLRYFARGGKPNDFRRALRLTYGCQPPDWRGWLDERLRAARTAVDVNWGPIWRKPALACRSKACWACRWHSASNRLAKPPGLKEEERWGR